MGGKNAINERYVKKITWFRNCKANFILLVNNTARIPYSIN